jgi:hypothetical protein
MMSLLILYSLIRNPQGPRGKCVIRVEAEVRPGVGLSSLQGYYLDRSNDLLLAGLVSVSVQAMRPHLCSFIYHGSVVSAGSKTARLHRDGHVREIHSAQAHRSCDEEQGRDSPACSLDSSRARESPRGRFRLRSEFALLFARGSVCLGCGPFSRAATNGAPQSDLGVACGRRVRRTRCPWPIQASTRSC